MPTLFQTLLYLHSLEAQPWTMEPWIILETWVLLEDNRMLFELGSEMQKHVLHFLL